MWKETWIIQKIAVIFPHIENRKIEKNLFELAESLSKLKK